MLTEFSLPAIPSRLLPSRQSIMAWVPFLEKKKTQAIETMRNLDPAGSLREKTPGLAAAERPSQRPLKVRKITVRIFSITARFFADSREILARTARLRAEQGTLSMGAKIPAAWNAAGQTLQATRTRTCPAQNLTRRLI